MWTRQIKKLGRSELLLGEHLGEAHNDRFDEAVLEMGGEGDKLHKGGNRKEEEINPWVAIESGEEKAHDGIDRDRMHGIEFAQIPAVNQD